MVGRLSQQILSPAHSLCTLGDATTVYMRYLFTYPKDRIHIVHCDKHIPLKDNYAC